MPHAHRAAVVFAASVLASVQAHAQGYSVVGGSSSSPAPASSASDAPAASDDGSNSAATQTAHGHRHRRDAASDGGVALSSDRHPWDYGGVAPGNGNTPPGLSRRAAHGGAGRGHVVVAWPGFQPTPSGSRIFLAVTAAPTVTSTHTPGRWTYSIHNAVVPVRNNRRALETEAFDTPVQRATLRQHGSNVELVLDMRAELEPQLTQEAGAHGLSYVFLDFAHWSPQRAVTLPQAQGVRLSPDSSAPPASPASPASDDERPPSVQTN